MVGSISGTKYWPSNHIGPALRIFHYQTPSRIRDAPEDLTRLLNVIDMAHELQVQSLHKVDD